MKFQNPSIHRSKVNERTDRRAESNMPFHPSNFFKVGGIKKKSQYTCIAQSNPHRRLLPGYFQAQAEQVSCSPLSHFCLLNIYQQDK